MAEDADVDALFDEVGDEEKKVEEEGEQNEAAAENDGEEAAAEGNEAEAAEETPVVVEEPEPEYVSTVVNFPGPLPGGFAHYASLPVSLLFDHMPFTRESFREIHASRKGQELTGTEKVAHEFPWRVVRWREVSEGGETRRESNTRLVTWSDGSQSLMIGDMTVFDVSRQPIRRGQNDIFNSERVSQSGFASHFVSLEEKLAFRLDKEPTVLRPKLAEKKIRKVKIVSGAGISAREEERVVAEEERRRAQSVAQRRREERRRAAASSSLERGGSGGGVELTAAFLEDGYAGGGGRERERGKRGREVVDESGILQAKQGGSQQQQQQQGAGQKKKRRGDGEEEDDGLQLYDDYDEQDSFINDDEEEGGDDVIDSDLESD